MKSTSPLCSSQRLRRAAITLTMSLSLALAGCSAALNGKSISTPISGVALHGGVMGGQQPVSGSTIQLYAAGTNGYGSAATALISSTVISDSSGSFSITNTYTCPSSATEVYIVATGGNPGMGTNANLALMTALGPCGNLNANSYITINELTTVAAVYALAPFMTGPTNVGTTATNTAGLANAFADVNTLVNSGTGVVPGPALPPGANLPVAELNTLADIIAICVNSQGGTAPGTPCGMLFAAAAPAGASKPVEPVTVALDIARNPGHNVSALYSMTGAMAPFQPVLGSAPNDFTVAINLTAPGMSAPSSLASDASGNIWIANSGSNTVTQLSNSGAVLSGTGYTASLNAPSAIAVDLDGTVWVTNRGNNTVSRLNNNGTPFSGSPYSGGGLNLPVSLGFDSQGTAWIGNALGSQVTSISSSGAGSSSTPAGVSGGGFIAVSPR